MGPETITVELYGIPRERAGRAEWTVEAHTVREALTALERACPRLAGLLLADGRVAPEYLLSIDGRRFVADASEVLRPGERVLLLSADVGG